MATQVKVNPNDPRVKRTRQLLKQALADLLAEKAFHEITVQEITERATLNRVTFYAHFEDKYDLLSTWVRDYFVERLEATLPVSSPVSAENLRLLCRLVLVTLREMHDHQCRPSDTRYDPLGEAVVQDALYAFILDWLGSSQDDESPMTSVETLATVMSWTIFGAGMDWSRSAAPRQLDTFLDEIVAVLYRGAVGVFAQGHRSDRAPFN
jgi:AcrR family transcriptional regulator